MFIELLLKIAVEKCRTICLLNGDSNYIDLTTDRLKKISIMSAYVLLKI